MANLNGNEINVIKKDGNGLIKISLLLYELKDIQMSPAFMAGRN